jgi:hypothetical protein
LEHIYNFAKPLEESWRVLKQGGQLIGVVPFLVNYHPDPSDFWRYSRETLQIILQKQGFTSVVVTPFGYGPCLAGWSHVEQVVPRILKMLIFPFILAGDWFIQKIRPTMNKSKFPLGYFFTATK